jgi:hypothetical protein
MKTIWVVLAALLLVGPVLAGPSETPTTHWIIQAQGGGDFLLSSTLNGNPSNPVTVVSPGWGFNGSLGYAFSNNFSLSVLAGYQVSGISAPQAPASIGLSLGYMPIQVVAQYAFLGENTRLYGLLGVGLAINSFSESVHNFPVTEASASSIISETDFLLSPGLGLSFKLSDKTDLFVQTKLDVDFFSQNLANWLPPNTQSTNKFSTPQLYLPVQVGLNFSVN